MKNVIEFPGAKRQPQPEQKKQVRPVQPKAPKQRSVFQKVLIVFGCILAFPIFFLRTPIIFLAGMAATWNLFLMLVFWNDPTKSYGQTAAIILFGAYAVVGIACGFLFLFVPGNEKGKKK